MTFSRCLWKPCRYSLKAMTADGKYVLDVIGKGFEEQLWMQIWIVVGEKFQLIRRTEDERDKNYAGCSVA